MVSRRASAQVLRDHEPLVLELTRPFPRDLREDLAQAARLALLEAVNDGPEPFDAAQVVRAAIAATPREPLTAAIDPDTFAAPSLVDDTHLDEPDTSELARETYGAKVAPHLGKLPPLERTVVEMYFFAETNSVKLARHLGISQPAVHHRLKNACKRLTLYSQIPAFTADQLRSILSRAPVSWPRSPHSDATRVEVLVAYYATPSIPATAQAVGLSISTVRRVLRAAIDQLGELAAHDPELAGVHAAFCLLSES